jgi:hypothetical protein
VGVPFYCRQFALATGGGTQDFTVSGEGRTPVAAYFKVVGATTSGTAANHHRQSWGATDGTNQYYGSIMSENALGVNSDCYHDHNTDAVIVTLSVAGAVEAKFTFNSFIVGGVRLNVSTAAPAAYLANVYFFFEGTYQVGTATTGSTVDVATSVAVSGFSPTFLAVNEFGPNAFGSGVGANCYASHGFVADNGGALQATACWHELDGATITQCTAITDNAFGSGWIESTTAVTERYVQYAFTTAGFSATPKNQGVAHHIGYLAGRLGATTVWAGHLSFPNATGTHNFTEPGVPVYAGLICQTGLPSEAFTSAASTEGFGSAMFVLTDQFSTCGSSDDAVALAAGNTSTRSFATNTVFNVQAPPGTTFLAATLTAPHASGFTVTVATAPAAARLMPDLVWGEFSDYEAINETLGVTEQTLAHGFTPSDETLGITEQTLGHGFIQQGETLGFAEEVAILGGASLDEGMGITESPFAGAHISIGEILGLVEDQNPLGGVAIGEILGILEEVDSVLTFAPSPSSPAGQAGQTGLQAGEGGNTGVEVGGP